MASYNEIKRRLDEDLSKRLSDDELNDQNVVHIKQLLALYLAYLLQ